MKSHADLRMSALCFGGIYSDGAVQSLYSPIVYLVPIINLCKSIYKLYAIGISVLSFRNTNTMQKRVASLNTR